MSVQKAVSFLGLNMVKIATMNVRGLQSDDKRKQFYIYCKKLQYDIICVQESHATTANERIWANEWGGRIFFANDTSSSKGVMIMFKPNLQIDVDKVTADQEGRYVMIDCKMDDQWFLLVNLYAPNTDKPEFFLEIIQRMSMHKSADRIMIGDFNLVLEPQKDSFNWKNNNHKACKILKTYMEEAQMVDIWREKHTDSFQFTWHKKKPQKIYARLDMILLNYALTPYVNEVCIKPSFNSDHSMVILNLDPLNGVKRGPGIWKLNTSLLRDKNVLDKMNVEIDAAVKQTQGSSACQRWEYVKHKIIKKFQSLAKERAHKQRENFEWVNQRLEKVCEQLNNKRLSEIEREALEQEQQNCKNDLHDYLQHKAIGARIRSRCQWYAEGEVSSKYFLGLEKVKAQNKNLNIVRCEDNTITRDQGKILREQAKFYRKLYSKDPKVAFQVHTSDGFKVFNEDETKQINQEFTFEDFTKALQRMASNKAPGCDGLNTEFYIVFWTRVGNLVWQAMLQSQEQGFLYKSA